MMGAQDASASRAGAPRLFISYSHDSPEHAMRVLELSNRLRAEGFDCHIDQYEVAPAEGWSMWMERQIEQAEFVLVVCTAAYRARFEGKAPSGTGRGVKWESMLTRAHLYEHETVNAKFVPVLFAGSDESAVPRPLYDVTRYNLAEEAGYVSLLRRLLHVPQAVKPPRGDLGSAKAALGLEPLLPREGQWVYLPLGFGELAETADPELAALQQEEQQVLAAGGDPSEVRKRMEALKRTRRESANPVRAGALVAGRYQLQVKLGQGGFGTVWKALDLMARRTVAVKVLHHHLADSSERVGRFERGARTMARLDHPNIVRVLDTGLKLADCPCFVMEFVGGGDLTAACKDGPFDRETAVPLLTALVDAVAYAHEAEVVHRDIKPDNVLLDTEGRPKLTDFDLVLAAGSTGATIGGMGSVYYCAREQMLDASSVDGRADVYALGMVGVFLLGGDDAVYGVYFSEDKALEQGWEPALAELLRHACSASRDDRLSSAAEMARRLRELAPLGSVATQSAKSATEEQLSRPPVPPKPVPSIEPKRSRLERGSWIAGILSAVLGIVALVFQFVQSDQAETIEEPEAPPPAAPPVIPPKDPATQSFPTQQEIEAFERWATMPAAPWADKGGLLQGWAEFEVQGVRQRMQWIPKGKFQMGSPMAEAGRFDAETQHEVKLTKGFWLAETECTQALWKAVMGDNPSHFAGAGLPVENVSWDDAQRFLRALNRIKPGLDARLPTEAEWEYAARAGSSAARYGELDDVAWHSGNAGLKTHVVKGRAANAWGLHDMLGNVDEWTAASYGPYPSEAVTDPSGPSEGSSRVVRGGSWLHDARGVRAAGRSRYIPEFGFINLGFRIARGQE